MRRREETDGRATRVDRSSDVVVHYERTNNENERVEAASISQLFPPVRSLPAAPSLPAPALALAASAFAFASAFALSRLSFLILSAFSFACRAGSYRHGSGNHAEDCI